MSNINKVTLLAGPNGAGKSRILKALYHKSQNVSGVGDFEIDFTKVKVTTTDNAKPTVFMSDINICDLTKLGGLHLDAFKNIPGLGDYKNSSTFITHNHNHIYSFVGLMDKYFRITNPAHPVDEKPEHETVKILYDKLIKNIRQFLSVDVKPGDTLFPELFGRSLPTSHLSDGQNILLQIALALTFNTDDALKDVIYFFDEPETHLHPKALIEFISTIQTTISQGDGQLFIATHSLPLMAHIGIDNIWYIDNQGIEKAPRSLYSMMDSMIGDEQRQFNMLTFFYEPISYALTRYAVESLESTRVASDSNPNDSQLKIMREILSGLEKVKVLDYGAGAGRLIPALKKSFGEDFSTRIDYFAYNKTGTIDKVYEDLCKDRIKEAYEINSSCVENRYLTDQTLGENGPYDIVILCNVLHEISPQNWIDIFTQIGNLLTNNGFALILEDLLMLRGELAHNFGFIVLTPEGARILFGIDDNSLLSSLPHKDNPERLARYIILKDNLTNASMENLVNSFHEQKFVYANKIRQIRNNGVRNDYIAGLKYGFYLQQYANAEIFLTENHK